MIISVDFECNSKYSKLSMNTEYVIYCKYFLLWSSSIVLDFLSIDFLFRKPWNSEMSSIIQTRFPSTGRHLSPHSFIYVIY